MKRKQKINQIVISNLELPQKNTKSLYICAVYSIILLILVSVSLILTLSNRRQSHQINELITFFLVPKFQGKSIEKEKKALFSILQMKPQPRVVVYGDQDNVCALFDCSVVHTEKIPHVNHYGTPFINSIFLHTHKKYNDSNLFVYVNSDIILPSTFARDILAYSITLESAGETSYLLIGDRYNIDENAIGNCFSFDCLNTLKNSKGKREGDYGVDYFVHTSTTWKKIPAFLLGRFAWDNWLVQSAMDNGATTIDISETTPALHPMHDYSHARHDNNAFYNEKWWNILLSHHGDGWQKGRLDLTDLQAKACEEKKEKQSGTCLRAKNCGKKCHEILRKMTKVFPNLRH